MAVAIRPPYSARERWQAAYRDWRRGRWTLDAGQHPADMAMSVLRMGFGPVFGRVFPATFDRRAAGADAAPWWLSGGVAAANAVAVYQPKGAASLAASYSNLANPGTYDAAPGTAPTFDAATGWTFNGSTQYLTTGVVPAAGWSVIVTYTNTSDALAAVLGSQASSSTMFYILPSRSSAVRYAYGDGSPNIPPGLTAGTLAMAGGAGYRNGVAENNAVGTWTGTGRAIILGAATATNGTVQWFFGGKIQAVAIYNTTLTAPQVLAISAAMAAL